MVTGLEKKDGLQSSPPVTGWPFQFSLHRRQTLLPFYYSTVTINLLLGLESFLYHFAKIIGLLLCKELLLLSDLKMYKQT